MMFEINLIKDRVVPRNLLAKRLVVVGSVVGVMLIVTLFIGFFGMQEGYAIATEIKTQEGLRSRIQDIKPQFDAVTEAERVLVNKKRQRDQLFALWDGPIHFGAFYQELIAQLPAQEAVRDHVAVINVRFETGAERNTVVMTTASNLPITRPDALHQHPVAQAAQALVDASARNARVQFVEASSIKQFTNPLITRQVFREPIPGCLLELRFRPINDTVFPYAEPVGR